MPTPQPIHPKLTNPKPKFVDSPWRYPILAGITVAVIAMSFYLGILKLPHFGGGSNVYEIEQQATIGVPYSASFAKSLIPLLGPESANSPSYTFYLGSGGFPPIGLVLDINGVLSGIPTGKSSIFEVCVKDSVGKSACKTYHLEVNSKTSSNNANGNAQTGDSFAGEWVTQSPGTYYVRDSDGSRYGEVTANFEITVRKVTNPGYEGYTCVGKMNLVNTKEYGVLSVIIPQGLNPIQFNSAYGGDTAQVSGNKLTSEHRGIGDGKQVIILELVNSNTMHVSMSVIPWDADHAGGDETTTPIVFVRK